MFFSATLDGEVGELARRYTHFAARFEGELPADRRTGDVDHRFVPGHARRQGRDARRAAAVGGARSRARLRPHEGRRRPARREAAPPRRRCRSRFTATRARRSARRALEHFDAGKVRTLVATDVAARGLDVDDITHVDQLRPAGGARRLHAPRRPHRPRRQGRNRRSRSCCRSSRPTSRASRGCRATSSVSRSPACRWRSPASSTRRGAAEAGPSGRAASASPRSRPKRCAPSWPSSKARAARDVVAAIKKAREFGDLSENFEYHAAKNEQGLLEARIRTLRSRLDGAEIVAGRRLRRGRHRLGRRGRGQRPHDDGRGQRGRRRRHRVADVAARLGAARPQGRRRPSTSRRRRAPGRRRSSRIS